MNIFLKKTVVLNAAIVLVIVLGGWSYSFLFWNHPYFGGFPDIAIFAQSAAQTLQHQTLTSESNLGGIYATQLFPHLVLITAALTSINGLHPMINLWVLQQLLPALTIGLFFLLGRSLGRHPMIGLLTAVFAGWIADLPVLEDQTFSQYLSTYNISFIFLLAILVFIQLSSNVEALPQSALFLFLSSAMLFYHHHFGFLRFVGLMLAFIFLSVLTRIHKQRNGMTTTITLLLKTGVAVAVLALLLNASEIIPFIQRYKSQIFTPAQSSPAIAVVTNSFSNTPMAKLIHWGQSLSSFSLLFQYPLLNLVIILGIMGIGFWIIAQTTAEVSHRDRTTALTKLVIVLLILYEIALFIFGFAIPFRYLHEILLLLLPASASWFYNGILRRYPGPLRSVLISIFIITSGVGWFPIFLSFEPSFNTGWANIRFLRWASQAMKPSAHVLTDPGSFHVLQSSVPYIQSPGLYLHAETPQQQELLRGLEKNLLRFDPTTRAHALSSLCPDFIVIDYAQTSQYFTIPSQNDYASDPNLVTIVFQDKGPKGPLIVLQPTHGVCQNPSLFF